MLIYPHFSVCCYSPLAPAEITLLVKASTLPFANASWGDDYQLNPDQPFQGVVESNSFEIARLDISQVRRSTPPKIKGWVSAVPGYQGSAVRLQYYQPAMLRLIGGLSVMAVCLSAASILQDLQNHETVNLLGLIYLVLPASAMLVQHIQLKSEFEKAQPLLNRLLTLEETAV